MNLRIDPMYCITLAEGEAINGAWVRIPSPDPQAPVGTVVSRFFGYSAHGGSAAAMGAARAWRDETGAQLWGERWPHQVATLFKPRIRRSRNNTSGEIGVHLSVQVKKGIEFQYWIALWRTGPASNRKTITKQFSVKKYGFDEAKEMAIQARKKGLEESLLSG